MPTNPDNDVTGYDRLPGTETPVTPSRPEPGNPATDGHMRDGVEEQRRVVKDGTISVQARVAERQAAEVPAMRYVLGIGVVLAIIGMVLAWLFLRQ